jgi:hypothetical protein
MGASARAEARAFLEEIEWEQSAALVAIIGRRWENLSCRACPLYGMVAGRCHTGYNRGRYREETSIVESLAPLEKFMLSIAQLRSPCHEKIPSKGPTFF